MLLDIYFLPRSSIFWDFFIIIIFKFSDDKNTFGLRSCDNRSVAIIWFGIIIYVALKKDLKSYFKMYVQ